MASESIYNLRTMTHACDPWPITYDLQSAVSSQQASVCGCSIGSIQVWFDGWVETTCNASAFCRSTSLMIHVQSMYYKLSTPHLLAVLDNRYKDVQ